MTVFNMGMAAAVVAQGIHQGSKTAMIMGGVIGSLFATSGFLIAYNNLEYGYGLGALTSVALCGRMSQYVFTTGQFNTPRGYMAALAAIGSIYNISRYWTLGRK